MILLLLAIPSGASGYMEERYLVSRQTVEYVLVRLQTAAALLRQTAGYAAYTFQYPASIGVMQYNYMY